MRLNQSIESTISSSIFGLGGWWGSAAGRRREGGRGAVYGACFVGFEYLELRLAGWEVTGSALQRGEGGGGRYGVCEVRCKGIGDRCSL